MWPPLDYFIEHMRRMRVRRTDFIVCYDNIGIFSAPRVAWTMRYFGAERVKVLNGGFKKWLTEGRQTENGEERIEDLEQEGDYGFKVVDPNLAINNVEDIQKAAYYIYNKVSDTQILDARPP